MEGAMIANENRERKSSRLPGFYRLPLQERMAVIADWAGLDEGEQEVLAGRGLENRQADLMIENTLGTFELPLGIAVNFLVNGRDYLVPMVVEEPSVVAGASYAARLAREGGGFSVDTTPPEMIAQIQVKLRV